MKIEKIDPYKHKERYIAWRKGAEKGISGVSKENSDIILRYLDDMEKGANIAPGSVKGARTHIRLNTLKDKMLFYARHFKERLEVNKITDITEEQLMSFFSDMRNGAFKTKYGTEYSSLQTYAKIFKAFWHWHQKVNRKESIEIKDITIDLDTRQEKPDWVYLTEEEVKILAENAKFKYKVLIYFLFDTGIRAPTELMNIRVSDFFNDFKELNIREEISKTFGRRIKLMICSDLIKQHIKANNLEAQDPVFDIWPGEVNRYLKSLAKQIFGDKLSPAGQKYSDLTMYDFRHCSCCYWLPRYKSESALKYRFGWKKSERIHYYSELLGMKDTISEQDLIIDTTKTEIEQKLERSEKEKDMLNEKMRLMERDLQRVMDIAQRFEKFAEKVI